MAVLCISFFDPGITSPAFQVALHWVLVLVLKDKGQHRVCIVFLPRFYSMHNLFQGNLPMGLTKWRASAPRIHSELYSMTLANIYRAALLNHFFICNIGTLVSKYKNAILWCVICFDPGIIHIRFCGYKESVTFFSYLQILVDMWWSTLKYVPYRGLLLDCTSLRLLVSMLPSHSSIIDSLMELCPWHTMGATIQLSRDAETDPHAGIRPVVLIGIPLPTLYPVLNSHSVESPITSSITNGATQQNDQTSPVDILAALIMSSESSVNLRSMVGTYALQSSVVTILSIWKENITQSCAIRCGVDVEHGAILSNKAREPAFLQPLQCIVTQLNGISLAASIPRDCTSAVSQSLCDLVQVLRVHPIHTVVQLLSMALQENVVIVHPDSIDVAKSSDFGCIIMIDSFQAAQRLHATLLCMPITNASRCYTGWFLVKTLT